MTRWRRMHGDDGVALVLALVFLIVVGIFMTAALQKSQAVSTGGVTLRERAQLQYALDGSVDKALQTLKTELAGGTPTSCTDPGDAPGTGSLALNGVTAEFTCTTLAGRAAQASETALRNYALVVTEPAQNALTTQSGVSTDLQVSGSVYLNGAVTNGAVGKPVEITDGDLVSPAGPARPDCQSEVDAVTQIKLIGSGQLRQCTEQTLEQALPVVDLPTAPTVNLAAALGSGVPIAVGPKTCTVFYPGLYTSRPTLANNSKNYFVSGLYFFRDVGPWQIDDAGIEVTGGQRALATDTSVPNNDCKTMTDAVAMASPVIAAVASSIAPYRLSYGNTWVFGGSSTLDIKKGSFTLFSPPAGGSSVPVSFVGASSYTHPSYGSQPLGATVLSGGGNNSSMEVNGKLFAPRGYVEIFSTNATVAAVKGGVVAYRVQLKASTSGSDALVISAAGSFGNPPPPFRTVRIETLDGSGISNGKAFAVATVSNFSPFTIRPLSWRSE